MKRVCRLSRKSDEREIEKKINCKIIIKNEFNEKSYIMHKQTRKTIKRGQNHPKTKKRCS